MNIKIWILAIATLTSAAALSQTPNTPAPSNSTPAKQPARINAAPPDGGKKFDANCGRCHSNPENLNPRITGTILRHMRVRANLSAQDAQDILRYLTQ
jgi:cytochrome c5